VVQDRRRADNRMARKRQFLEEVEHAPANGARVVCALEEYRLEMAKLLGDEEHLFGRQPTRIQKHGETVAAVWALAEHVDVAVLQLHWASL
jgi:hypothetical protein